MKDETIDNCLKTLYLIQKRKGSADVCSERFSG